MHFAGNLLSFGCFLGLLAAAFAAKTECLVGYWAEIRLGSFEDRRATFLALRGIFKSNYVGIVVFHRLVALTSDSFPVGPVWPSASFRRAGRECVPALPFPGRPRSQGKAAGAPS